MSKSKYISCCLQMDKLLKAVAPDLDYISVTAGGEVINYCPFCGKPVGKGRYPNKSGLEGESSDNS